MGLPVFIRAQNPQSLTIWNGRLFSVTQQTNSALPDSRVIFQYLSDKYIRHAYCASVFGVLAVIIHNPSLAYPLKCSCNRPISGLHVTQCCMCHFDILGAISCINSLATPAYLGMMPHIACGSGIGCVKISTNKICPAKILACGTLKDMGLLSSDILNGWDRFEEYVYGQVPVLFELF